MTKLQLADVILTSFVIPTEEWEPPIVKIRRKERDLDGDGLNEYD